MAGTVLAQRWSLKCVTLNLRYVVTNTQLKNIIEPTEGIQPLLFTGLSPEMRVGRTNKSQAKDMILRFYG